jgi:hypothetical protein
MNHYTKTLALLTTILASMFLTGCESTGHATRVEASQLGEYRDLTAQDLDEFSGRMFQRMIRSNLFAGRSGNPAEISVYLLPARISVEFTDNQRLIGLQQMITRSGVARFSGQLQVRDKQQFINYARSQKGRAGGGKPRYILEQHLDELPRRYEGKYLVKTYAYTLKLVDITPDSPSLGQEVLAESSQIIKQVRL